MTEVPVDDVFQCMVHVNTIELAEQGVAGEVDSFSNHGDDFLCHFDVIACYSEVIHLLADEDKIAIYSTLVDVTFMRG